MQEATFSTLWDKYALQWLNSHIEGKKVSDLCSFKKNAKRRMFENYNIVKKHCKDKYFLSDKSGEVTLNRYKRASVMAYTVLITRPLEIKGVKDGTLDSLFLKQRFAFYFGLVTILFDFKEEVVREKKIFDAIEKMDVHSDGNDTFVKGIYKDFLYAELYHNYDILAVANIYALLFKYVLGFTEADLLPNP